MIKTITLLTLLTLSTFSASLDVTGTVVSDNQKMIGQGIWVMYSKVVMAVP